MALQSRSIGLALFATAMGLVTAIPLVFTHVLFKGWIANFEDQDRKAAALTDSSARCKRRSPPRHLVQAKAKSDTSIAITLIQFACVWQPRMACGRSRLQAGTEK